MIHATLREHTQAFHRSVEHKLRVLLRADLSREKYAAILARFLGFYSPVEGKLKSNQGSVDPGLNLDQRWKTSFLSNDLIALGKKPEWIASLPKCTDLPCLETYPQLLGCLYVVEGSTLGGKIISAHLKTVLSIAETGGASFFQSYGDDVGRMWSSYLAVLNRHCDAQDDATEVVNSACQTFSSLDRWLYDFN